MSAFIIDASVAIKWGIDEDGTPAALALRHHHLAAPDLLMPECVNILWKKVGRGELSRDEAVLASRLLARADIDLMPMRPLMETATRIAVLLDHPAYDCVYLALAEAEDTPFVTADERLLRKVRQGVPGQLTARVVGLDEVVASH